MIAFHLRTGKHLFRPLDVVCEESHRSALERGWQVLSEVGGLPTPLEHVLWRSLRFDATRRPDSAREFLDVLTSLPEATARWHRTEAQRWWAEHRAVNASAQAASIRPQLKAK